MAKGDCPKRWLDQSLGSANIRNASDPKMSLYQRKIQISRLPEGVDESKTYWSIIAEERNDIGHAFKTKELSTWGYEDLDSAKKLAIDWRAGEGDFRRNVRIEQRLIEEQFEER
jgi:hypothetical protein